MSNQFTKVIDHATKLRRCCTCKEWKSLSEFHPHNSKKDGLRSDCKLCSNAASLRSYHNVGEKTRRKWHLGRFFKLTIEDYDSMLISQNGKCAICPQKSNGNKKYFAVDHCHLTGKVRGLLCDNCNRGLGSFKDTPELMKEAINYLTINKI